MFGRFDTRYKNPKTTSFISQPFGNVEYDLFRFESLDDGAYANDKIKISIAALNASTNPQNKFGTFSVLVRKFDDNDFQPQVLEQFNNVTLDPKSDNYIARIIGDTSVRFNFDAVASIQINLAYLLCRRSGEAEIQGLDTCLLEWSRPLPPE